MALKKSDMIILLNNEIGISKAEARDFVDDFFETFIGALASGETVRIQQFGVFELLNKNERVGRNPKTGHIHMISARRVVSFKASQLLRKRVRYVSDKPQKAYQQLDREDCDDCENHNSLGFLKYNLIIDALR